MLDDSAQRRRLEGRAELLEVAAVQYRLAARALEALGWRARVRRLGPTLREASALVGEVDRALDFVRRRAPLEGWARGPVLAAADEVLVWRARLRAAVERRLGAATTHHLGPDLERLERLCAAAPRLVLPHQRWTVACAALPRSLEAVAGAGRFGGLLERLFSRPPEPAQLPPWSAEDADELEGVWLPGHEALAAAFARLEAVDATSGTARSLRRRARRWPGQAPGPETSGAAVVVHAEFWRGLAQARLEQQAGPRFQPATLRPEEALAATLWLVRQRRSPEARLGLGPARGALLELGWVLSGAAGPGERPWSRLEALAEAADGDAKDPDWRSVHDGLALLVRVASSHGPGLPPPYRAVPGPTPAARLDVPLVELVRRLRALV